MTLGKKIQTLRKAQSLSQEELASMVMVSRQAVSKWESGESMPDIDNLLRLSRLFKVSVDYLLSDEAEKEQDTPAIASVIKRDRKKRIFIAVIVILFSIATALGFAHRYHITGLVISYMILAGFLSLFLLLLVLLVRMIKFFKK